MQPQKILITGDTGLLGANLAFLWRDSYDVIGVARGKSHIGGIRHISADLGKPGAIGKILREVKPHVIVHTAALVNMDECEREPELAKRFNIDMTRELTAEASGLDARLIYIGTDAFYQGDGDELCPENHPPTLKSVYAATKLEGEGEALKYKKALALRTNIYGFNALEKQSFGEWILHSLKQDQLLRMFTDVLYSPILVNDLAEVIEAAFTQGLTGLFNAGGTSSASKYEFGVKLKKIFGLETGKIEPFSVRDFSFAAWRSTNMSMDNTRLRNALGLAVPTPEESIRRFYRLYQDSYPDKLKEAFCL